MTTVGSTVGEMVDWKGLRLVATTVALMETMLVEHLVVPTVVSSAEHLGDLMVEQWVDWWVVCSVGQWVGELAVCWAGW